LVYNLVGNDVLAGLSRTTCMLTSLAYIYLFGLIASHVCFLMKIPRIIGMLFVGIHLGPNGFGFLDSSILNITVSEAAVMGAVLGAVSPAVFVPRMIQLIKKKRGTEKGISQMLLAVMSMACTIRYRCSDVVTNLLSLKFGRLWFASELLFFTLVGALVEVDYALDAGLS